MAGQHLTDRGLPGLWRAVADQWDYSGPSHRRRQPVASNSTPVEQGLITRNCCLPCCALTAWRDWSDLSRAQAWASVYRDLVLPKRQGPSLCLTDEFQGNAGHYIWSRLGCRSCQKGD